MLGRSWSAAASNQVRNRSRNSRSCSILVEDVEVGRQARLQRVVRRSAAAKAWMVSIDASSREAAAAAVSGVPCFSRPSRTRARSSAAAASVKVIATSSGVFNSPAATMATIRETSVVVLPVPAPASTKKVVSKSVLSRWRTASSAGTMVITGAPGAGGARRRPRPSCAPGSGRGRSGRSGCNRRRRSSRRRAAWGCLPGPRRGPGGRRPPSGPR